MPLLNKGLFVDGDVEVNATSKWRTAWCLWRQRDRVALGVADVTVCGVLAMEVLLLLLMLLMALAIRSSC